MFTFFCIVSRILFCALCSNKDVGAFESPRLPSSPWSCYVERLSALSLELQLGRARQSLGAPPSHCPQGRVVYSELQDALVPAWRCVSAGGPATASCPGAGVRWGALSLFTAYRGREGEG